MVISPKMKSFVDQVYVPDTVLITGFYKSHSGYVEWETRGGTGWNYLCYGEFPENGIRDPLNFLIPQGGLEAGRLEIKALDM
jgi:hydrogenase large subunit